MAGLTERHLRPDDDFWSWREAMYAFSLAAEPQDLRAVAAWLYVEMLESGYGSVCEFHYLHRRPDGASYGDPTAMAQAILTAAEDAGIPITLLPTLYQRGGFDDAPLHAGQRRFGLADAEFADLLRALALSCRGRNDRKLGLAIHSLRAAGAHGIQAALSAMNELDSTAPCHIHVAEQLREVQDCLRAHHRRPIELLQEIAPLDERWCLIHATHASEAELRLVAERGATISLCPSTEGNLGDGIFALPAFLEYGGRFGIGTDSQISVSPREELRWLEYGQRLAKRRRHLGVRPGQVRVGASLFCSALAEKSAVTGYLAGQLAAGQRADWLVLKPEHPALVGSRDDDWLDQWIFAGNDDCVRDVYIGGARIVRDGRHVRRDELLSRYRESVLRLRTTLSRSFGWMS
jgi:formimidoylglutamate deiminase